MFVEQVIDDMKVKKGTYPEKKYCEVNGCRKRAKHHFLAGYKAKEPHSMCRRHYREFTKKTSQQIKERPELSYES